MRLLLGHHGLRGDLAINLPAIEWLRKRTHGDIDMPIHRSFADMVPLFTNQPSFNPVLTDGYNDFPTAQDAHWLKERGYNRVYNPMQPHVDVAPEWHQLRHQTSAVLYDYFGEELTRAEQQISLVQWFSVPDLGKPVVAFAPFAGYIHNPHNDKQLTVERAQAIVDHLVARGYGVLQMSGAGEPHLRGATLSNPSYFEAVREMLGCKLLLHTDTGIGWVASGYRFPQLGLYGSHYYGPDKVANIVPVNPNGQHLAAHHVNDIPLDLILSTLDQALS